MSKVKKKVSLTLAKAQRYHLPWGVGRSPQDPNSQCGLLGQRPSSGPSPMPSPPAVPAGPLDSSADFGERELPHHLWFYCNEFAVLSSNSS